MPPLPTFHRGRWGRLQHFHLNEVFRAVERMHPVAPKQERDDPQREQPPGPLSRPIVAVGSVVASDLDHPLEMRLSWEQRQIIGAQWGAELSRSGEEGSVFAPPACLVFPFNDDNTAETREMFVAAPHVYHGKVTGATATAVNATYDVQTVDDLIHLNGMTPIDRWAGTNYEPLPVGASCLLLVTDHTRAGVRMVGFETPTFADCTQPAAAQSTINVESFHGLG